MQRKVLLVCGILSSLLYVVMNVLSAMRWEGYSYTAQSVSELFAIDAPSSSVWIPLGLLYDVLMIAFGVGVWQSAGLKRSLRVTAAMMIGIGLLGFGGPFFPMHQRGFEATLTDTMHIIVTAMISLCTLVAMAFGAAAFGKRFRFYSIATIAALLVFGGLTSMYAPNIATNEPTRWMGVTERINIGAYLLWVTVLAVVLLRTQSTRASNAEK